MPLSLDRFQRYPGIEKLHKHPESLTGLSRLSHPSPRSITRAVKAEESEHWSDVITTHILDTSLGKPAGNVAVALEKLDAFGEGHTIGEARTDADGRARNLLPDDHRLEAGRYRLHFDVGSYFTETRRETFYPFVSITFEVRDATQHYHVPLLVSPFGYSTYRGS